jgi:hypothetical protein
MPSVHTDEAEEIRLSQGLEKGTLRRTPATGLRVSITHLILSRAPSHVFERLIVAIISLASWRAFSAGGRPARRSVAGGIRVLISLGRRSVEGERVSEPVATADRLVFVVVVTASSVSRRAFSVGEIPARLAAAGVMGVLGRRSVGGESVSEPVVTVDRVVLVESWSIGDVASLSGDSLTSVDWRLEAVMGKIG